MYTKCCVPNCTSSRQDAILHKLPNNFQRLKKWIEFIPHLRNKNLTDLAHLQVCHKHFELRFLTQKSRLLMTAYPTLFLGSSSTNTLKSIENTSLALADHQYSKKMHHDHLYAKPQDAPPTSKMKDLDVNFTVPNIPQVKQSIQAMDLQPSTSKMKDLDLNLTIPNIPQVKQSIHGMDLQPSTSKMKDLDLNLTIPNIPQVKQSIHGMDLQPSTSKMKDLDLNLTIPNIPQVKQSIQGMSVQPSTSKMKDLDLPNITIPSIPQVKQSIQGMGVQPSTSKMKDLDLPNITIPSIPQVKQSIQGMDLQPSTSKMKDLDLPNITIPSIPQVKQSIQGMGVQPSTSKMKDLDLPNITIPSIPQVKQSIQGLDVQPSTSNAEDVTPNTEKCQISSDACNKRVRRAKIVTTAKSLTPRCRKMYEEYRKARKTLSFTQRAKRALQFSKKHSLEDIIQDMHPLARTIFLMQINMCTKNPKGRRFSMEEKLISLSILKQGPKSYRFIQKIFILPSESTLKKMISKLNLSAGINPQIFNAIKNEVNTWKEQKKFCSIIFDEMAVQAGLTYTYKDQICGFVDTTQRKKMFADHALVFLIKGVVHKWQQPIAYYLCEGSTSTFEVKRILKEIVEAVGETGLIPLVVISDQGASFRSAINSLQMETRAAQIRENKNPDDTIHINGFNMFVIFDPPHLIKGVRNNFLTKNIKFQNKVCTWSDIVDVYMTDCDHAESRFLSKLNDEHIIPDKIKKMKVKNCVRVFSKTVAAALNYTSAFAQYSDGRPISKTLRNTAEIVSFMDDLFDSVNGSAVYNKKRKGFIQFHRSSFNCEDNDGTQLLKIKSLFMRHPEQCVYDNSGETGESSQDTYRVIQEATRERLKIQSRAYTAGWVVRKILLKVNCSLCKKELTTKESTEVHKWLLYKEYKKTAKKLTYPAEAIVRYFGIIIEETNNYLETNAHLPNIGNKIRTEILKKYSFEHIACEEHRAEILNSLLSITIKLCIHNWCTIINKILNGVDIVRLERKELPEMQTKALVKYKKKHK